MCGTVQGGQVDPNIQSMASLDSFIFQRFLMQWPEDHVCQSVLGRILDDSEYV